MVVVCYQKANELGIAFPGPDLAQLATANFLLFANEIG
jgi:hypothetical protein